MSAAGTGYTRIAKWLNVERTPCPRPQQGRPSGWSPSSVLAILKRRIYRGEIVWNQTRKRDRWGRKDATSRPTGEWITIQAPELRIVSDVLWQATRGRSGRHQGKVARVDARHGRSAGARRRIGPPAYRVRPLRVRGVVLSTQPESRIQRAFFYGCSANHKRGQAGCDNGFVMRKERIDAAVLESLGGKVLRPAVVSAVLDGVFQAISPNGIRDELASRFL